MSVGAERTLWRLRPGIVPEHAAPQDICQVYFASAQTTQPKEQLPLTEPGSAVPPATDAAAHPQLAASAELKAAAASIVSGALAAQAQREQRSLAATHGAGEVNTPSTPPPLADLSGAAQHAPAPAAAQRDVESSAAAMTLYISPKLQLSYLASLKQFLQRKGVATAEFNPDVALKPPAVVLLAAGDMPPPGCLCFLPDENKAALWSFLQREFTELKSR